MFTFVTMTKQLMKVKSQLGSNAIGVSLNDDLGVPRRSPAGRGSTCEGGPINVVHVIFIICAHHDLLCSLI